MASGEDTDSVESLRFRSRHPDLGPGTTVARPRRREGRVGLCHCRGHIRSLRVCHALATQATKTSRLLT